MDPQTESPLAVEDLVPIDMAYMNQMYKPDFSDEKEKMLSRLLYERDALVRIVAKMLDDKPAPPAKRMKSYTWHHFKQDIDQADIKRARKQWNKQLKSQPPQWTKHIITGDREDQVQDLLHNAHIHPLTQVHVQYSNNKIVFTLENTMLHEMPTNTRKAPQFFLWHCDMSIFFAVYPTFVDIYALTGYVDTWHIKHTILDIKCCGNGYLMAILHSNKQIDIFDLRKLSQDDKGLLHTLPSPHASCIGFLKSHDLVAFGDQSTSPVLM